MKRYDIYIGEQFRSVSLPSMAVLYQLPIVVAVANYVNGAVIYIYENYLSPEMKSQGRRAWGMVSMGLGAFMVMFILLVCFSCGCRRKKEDRRDETRSGSGLAPSNTYVTNNGSRGLPAVGVLALVLGSMMYGGFGPVTSVATALFSVVLIVRTMSTDSGRADTDASLVKFMLVIMSLFLTLYYIETAQNSRILRWLEKAFVADPTPPPR